MTSILRKMRVTFLTIVTCIEAPCVRFIALSPYLTSNPYYLTYTIPSTTPPAEPINDKKTQIPITEVASDPIPSKSR